MTPIIEVKNLSKEYILSHRLPYVNFRDILTDSVKNFVKKPLRLIQGQKKTEKEEFWALKDVNFSVQKGEAIGLIGANGSGKSTLLKILSQITSPTTGEIHLRGRIASLLEVGTGFHHELTGRENIYLNGAILGMSRKEIESKFDQIVEFSGVEKFLDTPVKRYSSGMVVRLAFSVAAHLEPEILLVDEVLAVGDAEFQRKSLGKMDEVTKDSGRTIIFVSHNLEAIRKLCSKCVLLKEGHIVMYDETAKVIEKYLEKNNMFSGVSLNNRSDRDGRGDVVFTSIRITNHHGDHVIKSGQGLKIHLQYASKFTEKIRDARVIITIANNDLHPVLQLDSDITATTFTGELDPRGEIICETGPVNLSEGSYFVEIDFLIKGLSMDRVSLASEFILTTDTHDYNYRIAANKITNNLIKYDFKQIITTK